MKKILQILFFSFLIFGGFKIYGYLDKVSEYEGIINKKIYKIDIEVNKIKPEIQKTEKNIDEILKIVEDLSIDLINFGKVLDKTLNSLDEILINLEEFDKNIKSIKPFLYKINKSLKIVNLGLYKISPAIKNIENTTKSINKKLDKLKRISNQKIKILNEIMKFDFNFMNNKIADFIKDKFQEELNKQKELQEAIGQSQKVIKNIEKIIPKKQIEETKVIIEKNIPIIPPTKEIKKVMPNMGGFGF